MAKQQVYFTKDAEPSLWQALRELKDNPIAHYGLLQARRRSQQFTGSKRWKRIGVMIIIGIIVIALVCQAISMIQGFTSILSAITYMNTTAILTFTVASALTLYVMWFAQGVFFAVRDSALSLANPQGRSLSAIDEIVSISALSNTEILAGTLKLIVRPMLPRIIIGALIPLIYAIITVTIDILSGIVNLHQTSLNHNIFELFESHFPRSLLDYILDILIMISSSAFTILHSIVALIILSMLMITCGRKIGNLLLATMAGCLHTIAAICQLVFTGLIIEARGSDVKYFLDDINFILTLKSPGFFFTIISPLLLLFFVRLLRNSKVLRSITLMTPSLLLSAIVIFLSNNLFDLLKTLNYIVIPLLLLGPATVGLTLSTSLFNSLASPVFCLIGSVHYYMPYRFFNVLWLIILIHQVILLVTLLMATRDAIRLYRQPGQL